MSEEKVEYNVDDLREIELWKIDQAIEDVKENNEEIERLKNILDDRINDLKMQFEQKKESLLKQNHFKLTTLGEFAKTQKLKKAKTQSKYSSLNGDIIIKHPQTKFKKPTKDKVDKVSEVYPELVEEEVVKKLNWRDLKSRLIMQNDRVFDKETGEDVTDLIDIENTEEEIIVK